MKNILRLIAIFVILFSFHTAVFAENKTITVVADTHLSSDKQNNSMTPSVSKLLSVVKQINQSNSDCVVFLGDNTQSVNRIDVAMFAKIIKKLNKPVYVTVGNRDVSKTKQLDKKEYYRILNKFSSNKISSLPCYKKQGDLVFVFMSGVNETFPTYKGYYKNDELIFLDETLTKFKDKSVIIFQHFPIIASEKDETRQTVKPESYLSVLSKHKNVLAVVSGHYHKEDSVTQDNIRYINVGSLGLSGEYEQIRIFQNRNGRYSVTTGIYNVN